MPDPDEEQTNGESEGGDDSPVEPGSARPDDGADLDPDDHLAASIEDVPKAFPSGEPPTKPSEAEAPVPFG